MNDKLSEIHEAVCRIDERTKSTHEWVKNHESRIMDITKDVDQAKGAISTGKWLASILIPLGGLVGAILKDFFLPKN